MSWQKILASDVSVRSRLLQKIHLNEAFWMIPSFSEELWVFASGENFAIFRAPSELRHEFIASEHLEVNALALLSLGEILPCENSQNSFFCAQDLGAVGGSSGALHWATMLEPTPKERVRSRKEQGMENLSCFRLLNQPASKNEQHEGYPEPMPVFCYELND